MKRKIITNFDQLFDFTDQPYEIEEPAMSLTRNQLLMRDVVIPCHPKFKQKDFKMAEYWNVDLIVEETLLLVSKFLRKSKTGRHEDYNDGSDHKLISVRETPSSKGKNSYRTEIAGIVSANGVQKNGALRVTIANEIKQTVDFLYIPKKEWINLGITYNTNNKGRIVSTYYAPWDDYNKFDPYRVKSFNILANKKDS